MRRQTIHTAMRAVAQRLATAGFLQISGGGAPLRNGIDHGKINTGFVDNDKSDLSKFDNSFFTLRFIQKIRVAMMFSFWVFAISE
jgi:hypothetical protein